MISIDGISEKIQGVVDWFDLLKQIKFPPRMQIAHQAAIDALDAHAFPEEIGPERKIQIASIGDSRTIFRMWGNPSENVTVGGADMRLGPVLEFINVNSQSKRHTLLTRTRTDLNNGEILHFIDPKVGELTLRRGIAVHIINPYRPEDRRINHPDDLPKYFPNLNTPFRVESLRAKFGF